MFILKYLVLAIYTCVLSNMECIDLLLNNFKHLVLYSKQDMKLFKKLCTFHVGLVHYSTYHITKHYKNTVQKFQHVSASSCCNVVEFS